MKALLLLLFLATPEAFPAPFALVAEIKGLASLEPMHTNLKVGMALAEGDRVTVMSNSMLRLKFPGLAAVQIGSHSEVTLKRSSEKTPMLRLAHGMVLSVVNSPVKYNPKFKNRFEIRTGQLTLGVQGADYFVRSEGDTAAFVCPCSGAVKAQWGKNEILLHGRNHNRPVSILTFKNKPDEVKEKGTDHSDEDIAALKKLL